MNHWDSFLFPSGVVFVGPDPKGAKNRRVKCLSSRSGPVRWLPERRVWKKFVALARQIAARGSRQETRMDRYPVCLFFSGNSHNARAAGLQIFMDCSTLFAEQVRHGGFVLWRIYSLRSALLLFGLLNRALSDEQPRSPFLSSAE
jgi:hypothetical protein